MVDLLTDHRLELRTNQLMIVWIIDSWRVLPVVSQSSPGEMALDHVFFTYIKFCGRFYMISTC